MINHNYCNFIKLIIVGEEQTERKQILIGVWQVVSIDLSSKPSIFTHVRISSVFQHKCVVRHTPNECSDEEVEKKRERKLIQMHTHAPTQFDGN